jgi:hypothetical protein
VYPGGICIVVVPENWNGRSTADRSDDPSDQTKRASPGRICQFATPSIVADSVTIPLPSLTHRAHHPAPSVAADANVSVHVPDRRSIDPLSPLTTEYVVVFAASVTSLIDPVAPRAPPIEIVQSVYVPLPLLACTSMTSAPVPESYDVTCPAMYVVGADVRVMYRY